jgi:hypothetical protein
LITWKRRSGSRWKRNKRIFCKIEDTGDEGRKKRFFKEERAS